MLSQDGFTAQQGANKAQPTSTTGEATLDRVACSRRSDPEKGTCLHSPAAALPVPITRCGSSIYDEIRVGSIGMRSGVPVDKDQWGWNVGFYPASERGLHGSGTAKNFDKARATFEAAWQWLLPKLTEADFTAWRRQRAWDAWKQAMMCGAAIGIADVERACARCAHEGGIKSRHPV